MGVCSAEAYEIHGDNVSEIDVSDLSIDGVVDLVERVISGENYPIGNVDFLDWILSN